MYVAPPPDIGEIVSRLAPGRLPELLALRATAVRPEYVHWNKLRQLTPPDGLTHEEWWLLIWFARDPLRRPIPLLDAEGGHFVYGVPDLVARQLHYVDQRCSGEVAMPEVVTADDQARRHYLVNSLMEEAIRSSQLEGATTTRKVAREMLSTGREPTDRSERMIVNNYLALEYMRDQMDDHLTSGAVVELQRILTDGTLDDPSAAGRLQRPDEVRVSIVDSIDGTVMHDPPPAVQLPERLERMCAFANEPDSPDRFIHPVIRAILLHFWLAYDHPFEDGNGRTARALFYWYMRTRKYWLIEYLSISRIIRDAPAKYSRAFLFAETDGGDVTYFVVHQLEVIERAIDQLHNYLRKQIDDVREVEMLLRQSDRFNHRQLALLGDALRAPGTHYSFQAHATSHGVTHETARNDLLPLSKMGLLEQRRQGRRYSFSAPVDVARRLKDLP